MAPGLKVEDRWEGAANFSASKERITYIFEEAEVWGIVEKAVLLPTTPDELAAYKKLNAKAKRLIMEGIKDHVIPHVRGKTSAYEMWEALTKLYQSSNQRRKIVLKEKLKATKMIKSEEVASYLTRITQVRNELAAIGEKVETTELVRLTL